MKNKIYILIILASFFGCSNNKKENEQKLTKQSEVIEESKNEIGEVEEQSNVNQTGLKIEKKFEKKVVNWSAREKKLLSECFLKNPDTSVIGICIWNPKSVIENLGSDIKMGGDGRFRFFTKDKSKYLNLTVHPASYLNQVSIFEVGYVKNSNDKYDKLFEKNLETNTLKTEKDIELGMSKSELISKLGICYKTIDSTAIKSTILYRIEMPQKTLNDFLNRYNMPIYYAEYDFENAVLKRFEFGFEYP